MRVGAIAGAVFTAGLGTFTFYWLGAWLLWTVGSAIAVCSVFALSCFSAYAAGHDRIFAV